MLVGNKPNTCNRVDQAEFNMRTVEELKFDHELTKTH